MKAAINMILFFLTLSFCTNAAQAQARRATLAKQFQKSNLVIRDSVSTKRVIDHRTTRSKTNTNRRVVDHRQKSNIIALSNRTEKIKKLPPDGTSNTRSLRQRVVVKRKQ